MDEDEVQAVTTEEESPTGYEEPDAPETAEEEMPPEPTEEEPTAEADPPYRPQVGGPANTDDEAYLRENLGEELFTRLTRYNANNYAVSRQSETVAEHYVSQVDAAAPGFIGVQERTTLRQLSAAQQADPGAVFLAASARYLREASETGNVAGALDKFAAEWQSRRGKPNAPQAPPPVLPPSQRTVSSGSVVRPAAPRAGGNIPAEVRQYMDTFGMSRTEAEQTVRGVEESRGTLAEKYR